MSHEETDFRYSISRNQLVVIIAFTGKLQSQSLELLEKCKCEIDSLAESKAVIIDFAGLESVALDCIPTLAQIQKSVRAREIALRLSALSFDIRDLLEKRGIVRSSEIRSNIREAISSIVHVMKEAGHAMKKAS